MSVHLKNFPLDFLKEKPESFFHSEKYKKAEELFNSLKRNPKNLTTPDDTSYIPIDYLVDMLTKIYLHQPIKVETEQEEMDWLYCRMRGLETKDTELKARKYIDYTASEVEGMEYLGREIHTDHIVDLVKKKRSEVNKDRELLSSIDKHLKPKETSSVIFDIINKINFYDGITHSRYYDDLAYEEYIRNKFIKNESIYISSLPTVTLSRHKERDYFFHGKNIEKEIEGLIDVMVAKYSFNKTNTHRVDKTDEEDYFTKAIRQLEIVVSKSNIMDTTRAYVFTQLEMSNKWQLDKENLNNGHFRYMVFDLDGIEITDLVDSIDKEGILTFKENRLRKGRVFVVYDTLNKELFQNTTFAKCIEGFPLVRNNVRSFKVNSLDTKEEIYLNGLNKSGIHYTCISAEGFIVKPTKVELLKNKIVFHFDQPFYGGHIHILPLYTLLRGWSNFKVNEDNIYEILHEYDIFSDQVVLWKGNIQYDL